MPDLLVRDIPKPVLEKIDAHCRQAGVSRQVRVRQLLLEYANGLPPVISAQVENLSEQGAKSLLLDILGGRNAHEALQDT